MNVCRHRRRRGHDPDQVHLEKRPTPSASAGRDNAPCAPRHSNSDQKDQRMRVKKGGGSTRQLSHRDKWEVATTAFLDAGLKPPTRIGITEYQTCPQCSQLHANVSKRRHKCLAMKVDNEWFGWVCNGCGWEGGSNYKNAVRFVSKQTSKERDRKRKATKRREAGATPRSQSKTAMAARLGISRASLYRREKLSQEQQEIMDGVLRETNSSTTSDRLEDLSPFQSSSASPEGIESQGSLDSRDSQ